MIEWDGEVGVCDSSDKGSMFSRGQEWAELMTVCGDIDREDRGNFYHRWRRRGNYWRRNGQGGWSRKRRTAGQRGMFRESKFDRFSGEGNSGPPGGGNVGWKGIQGGRPRGQSGSGSQRGGVHDVHQEEL